MSAGMYAFPWRCGCCARTLSVRLESGGIHKLEGNTDSSELPKTLVLGDRRALRTSSVRTISVAYCIALQNAVS